MKVHFKRWKGGPRMRFGKAVYAHQGQEKPTLHWSLYIMGFGVYGYVE